MRTLTKIAAATALAGSLALPALAQTDTNDDGVGIGASIGAGLNFDNGIAFELGGGVNVDTDPGSSAPEGLDPNYAVATDTTLVGTSVMSGDGLMIGTVADAYTAPDMQTIVRVEAADGVDFGGAGAFYYPLAADADVDGQLQVPMTLAELQAEGMAQIPQ